MTFETQPHIHMRPGSWDMAAASVVSVLLAASERNRCPEPGAAAAAAAEATAVLAFGDYMGATCLCLPCVESVLPMKCKTCRLIEEAAHNVQGEH